MAASLAGLASSMAVLVYTGIPTSVADSATRLGHEMIAMKALPGGSPVPDALGKAGLMHEDDPQVGVLRSQLNAEQQTLGVAIEHLGDVVKMLDAVTKAVDIGSQLASKAMSL